MQIYILSEKGDTSMKKAELEGQCFGDLQVIRYHKVDNWGSVLWECRCKCGNICYVRTGNLHSGNTTECRKCASRKHGMCKTKIYSVWQSMKTRCENPNAINYHNYGGRGISYDPSWGTFIGFYNDMSASYEEGLTLERIDNNLGYSKSNCMWATPREQNLNMRTNKTLAYNGKMQTITEWAQQLQIRRRILYSLRSYHKDWTDRHVIEEAMKRTSTF